MVLDPESMGFCKAVLGGRGFALMCHSLSRMRRNLYLLQDYCTGMLFILGVSDSESTGWRIPDLGRSARRRKMVRNGNWEVIIGTATSSWLISLYDDRSDHRIVC